MRILLAVAALAASCAAQPVSNCQQNGPITVCDAPPQKHKVCASIEVQDAPGKFHTTGQKCRTYISYPKHWYAPLSQSENIRLQDGGDSWTITALDAENCQQKGRMKVCDDPPLKHRSCQIIAQYETPEGTRNKYKCHSYILHPKHYYGPLSLSSTVVLNEGDSYQVTVLDKPVSYGQATSGYQPHRCYEQEDGRAETTHEVPCEQIPH